MKFCSNCGNHNDGNVAFCINCGYALQDVPIEQPVQEPLPLPQEETTQPMYMVPEPQEVTIVPEPPSEPEPVNEPTQEQIPPQEEVSAQAPQYVQPYQEEPLPLPQEEPVTQPMYMEPEPLPPQETMPPPVPVYQPPLDPPPPQLAYDLTFAPPKKSSSGWFVQNGLGFVVMGVILLCAIGLVMWEIFTTGYFSSYSFDNPFYTNMLNRFFILAIVAIFTVVATRIKGPDLSAPLNMILATAIIAAYPGTTGLIIAVAVCFVIGCLNGTIISLLNAPSIIVTLITAAILFAGTQIFVESVSDSSWFLPWISPDISQLNLSLIAFGAAVVLAFGTLAFTRRLIKPKPGRKYGALSKSMDILGYGFVALIACLAGYLICNRINMVYTQSGYEYETSILIIFLAVQSCKVLKNGMLALVYGLLFAIIITISEAAMSVMGFANYWFDIFYGTTALILLCTACIAQGGWKSALGANLSE